MSNAPCFSVDIQLACHRYRLWLSRPKCLVKQPPLCVLSVCCKLSTLVAGNSSIRRQRPCVDSTHQVRDPLEAHMRKIHRHLRAANPMMAYDDPMRVRVEFGETRGYVTHRNVQRAREGRDRDFLRLAHVENFEPLAAVEPRLELQWFDFLYRRHRNNPIYRGLTPNLRCVNCSRLRFRPIIHLGCAAG